MNPLIDIQNPENYASLPKKVQFEKWVSCALQHVGAEFDSPELTIRVVSSIESQALNLEYRGKDKPTNVLSFPFEAPPQIECDLLGDLVICEAVMNQEALEQNKTVIAHWAHLVVHGTLHLLGFDHIEEEEAEEMESIEIEVLASLGFENPYQ